MTVNAFKCFLESNPDPNSNLNTSYCWRFRQSHVNAVVIQINDINHTMF